MNIVEALDDPKLLGAAIRTPATFTAWRTLLKTFLGLPLSVAELTLYRDCTGRLEPPTAPASVLWLVAGRRSGKSFTMALVACFFAIFRDWRGFLAPGERAVILCVAADREQAKILRRYISGIILGNPMFAPFVEAESGEAIEMRGGVVIEVGTCSYRSVRGRSVCVALLDEVAFWRSENTANPDKEVWRAIRASMATFDDKGVAIIGSSPYAKRGLLYDNFRRFHGQDDRRNLVWKAPTKVMNPTINDAFLEDEREADPVSFESEYLANFRTDIDSYISQETVERAVLNGIFEILPKAERSYEAFIDAASGSGSDSMTMAIAHRDGEEIILDLVAERRPPFDPDEVCAEFAEHIKRYGIWRASGDKWASGFVEAAFRRNGIDYEASAAPKSDLYKELMPMLNAGRVRLLDNKRLVSQLIGLERRTARGGRDSIDHSPGAHDDVINAACGAIVAVGVEASGFEVWERLANGAPWD